MTRPDDPSTDELIARYHEASARDTRRPADPVREAVLAHARMVNASSHPQAAGPDAGKAAPANQSRWKLSLLASVALAALSGLLVLQFDRGTPEEQDAGYGQRSPSVSAAPPLPAAAPIAPPPPPSAAAPVIPRAGPQAEPPRSAQQKAAAPAQSGAGTTRNEAADRRASTTSQAREAGAASPARLADAAPAASPREQADAAFPASPATSKGIAPPPPAPAAAPRTNDAASLRSAAPTQPQEASRGQEAQESRAQQAPRARLLPGSPAAAMAMALHEAARTGRITQLDSLLRQGALINEPDAAGRTPLALAVIHGQTAAVQRLLAAGANTAWVDREGLTALQHARRLGLSQIASLIEAAS